jgi:hypothetical protein
MTSKSVPFALSIGLALVAASGCAARVATPAAPSAPPVSAATSPAPPPPEPLAASTATAPPAVATSPAIDESAVAAATGAEKPEKSPDGVVRATFPRKDVEVAVDGWKLNPFMGLTSWTAFSPGKAGVAEAMVMGDLVLFEDEVNPVMSVLLDNGVDVTALHNHFLFDSPKVYFMHIGGEGTVAGLGKGVRLALAKSTEIRKKTPKPPAKSGAPALPAKSNLDAAKLEAALGVKGVAKDGMFKATMGRQTSAACGCPIGKSMGVNTWSAFAGTDDNAVVDGDFAVAESELEPVLKSLRGAGINVVAIHHHMSGEIPKILFLHYWGRGKAVDLAGAVRKALDLTAWEGSTKAS